MGEMPKKSILGSEFRLTRAAERYILGIIEDIEAQPDMAGCFPLITWSGGGAPDEEYIPGPSIAVDGRHKFLDTSPGFYEVGEHKIPIALDKRRTQECRDKVLDYRCKQLVLVYLDEAL